MMQLAQSRICMSRTASNALHYLNNYQCSNVKTLEGFIDKYRNLRLNSGSKDLSYSQFQAEITSGCQHWDFTTINYSKMHILRNLLRLYKAHNTSVLYPLQKQFAKSLPDQKELSYSDSLKCLHMLTPENIVENNFLKQTFEYLVEKYQKDPFKTENKITLFGETYAFFNLPDPKLSEFLVHEFQSMFAASAKKYYPVEPLPKMASYLSYDFKNCQNLHEYILKRIEKHLAEDKSSFYKGVNDVERLRYLWTWFHSIELYDKELYLKYKETVFKRTPFLFSKKIVTQSRQKEFGEFLQEFLKGKRIKHEQPLGIYQVDYFIEGSNVAIEYNGKSHYINFSERETGTHWTRARNLRDSGYKLVDIAYYEWNALTTVEEKNEYLRKKFQEANAEI